MSSMGETTIPDSGRAWCYRRGGSAYPKRGSAIARGLGLRSFLPTTFVAYTRRSAVLLHACPKRPRRRAGELGVASVGDARQVDTLGGSHLLHPCLSR